MRRRTRDAIDDSDQDSQDDENNSGPIVSREKWCSSFSSFFLALLTLTSLFDLVLSWIASGRCVFLSFTHTGNGTTDTTMSLLGAARLIWIVIIYGSFATFVPKRELSGPGRRAKMYTQGGHSLMLTYFLGCGAVAELVRDRCCREISGILRGKDRVRNALIHRGFGLCVPLLICHFLESYWSPSSGVHGGGVELLYSLCLSPFCLGFSNLSYLNLALMSSACHVLCAVMLSLGVC